MPEARPRTAEVIFYAAFVGSCGGKLSQTPKVVQDVCSFSFTVTADESKNEDCVEIQNPEFTGSEKDENEELSFENTDEGKTILEKQPQEDENRNLKFKTNVKVSNKND
ncbi:hypothetical protein NPIL_357441 [Nephila pilipes]|uniref:Uncharacterized protein n=1 Tax=Nephila pilipes TaxID=299642 RepID=A0A8X6Q907_NEPPI|nr:hypothetical protein NPIL_357441 [Nephila pilipes]